MAQNRGNISPSPQNSVPSAFADTTTPGAFLPLLGIFKAPEIQFIASPGQATPAALMIMLGAPLPMAIQARPTSGQSTQAALANSFWDRTTLGAQFMLTGAPRP